MSTPIGKLNGNDAAAQGRSGRSDLPRSAHGEWTSAPDRPDPVELVEAQNADRLPWLVAIRRGRMSASPFAFYRGAARVMATDLSATQSAGLHVQLCGDAHLSNFGAYASPERQLVFDLNDFDETLPGPFEWDVKRLAASFTIAGQHRGFSTEQCRELAIDATRAFRTAIRQLAQRGWLESWYMNLPLEKLIALGRKKQWSKSKLAATNRFIEKSKTKDHLEAAKKLVEEVDGAFRFKSMPPLLVPYRELPEAADPDRMRSSIWLSLERYRNSLDHRTRVLFDRYQLADLALKVVGVGSVGTRCSVGLLVGRRPKDVLILQIKEATRSVLEEHLPPSEFESPGQRVIEGQRLMQAASDIFLGWTTSDSGRAFYIRQLKDWKGSVDIDTATPKAMRRYAHLCGWTLARAHAVSGDPAAIAGYLGKGHVFDTAMGEFAVRYAAQNLVDHEAFKRAITERCLEVIS